jgi:hypothetical protein
LLLAFILISAYAVVVRMREEHIASIISYEIQWIVLLVLCRGVILIWMRSSVRVLQANLQLLTNLSFVFNITWNR